jgi:hypothetical protein
MNIDPNLKSIEHHRANPDVSIEEHVRSRRIELGISVMKRERVYLDKCYWIDLRDVQLGRSDDPNCRFLLESLRVSVQKKERICPISESVFLELLKQEDPNTRTETAGLIDELSQGVTLIPHYERVATEVSHFIHSRAGYSVYPLENLVWSKLSYVLGIQHPIPTAFPLGEQRAIQKAFFDYMWEFALVDLISRLDRQPDSSDFYELADQLNRENPLHADSLKSFQQAYRAEINGALTLAAPIACEVAEALASRSHGSPISTAPTERESCERGFYNLFCQAIAKKEVALALRTLHLTAMFHAAVRWDKKRRITANDLYDFHHAEAAIAYCDVFLTESPLRTLLLQRHLQISHDFACLIISDKSEAAAWASR